jgi:FAD/FMN-containing dehydrogenase
MERRYTGWGGYPKRKQDAVRLDWPDGPLPAGLILPFGNGRSYGDQCLCTTGTLVDVRGLNRFVNFDTATGLLRVQAGVTLGEINAMAIRHGWLLPVNPGTQHVTVGGAIANDVHGKNQHKAGSFGHHVREMALRRSDGTASLLQPGNDWFAATVGGMGLTGIVTETVLQLKQVASSNMLVDTHPFETLEDYLELSRELDGEMEYSIGWVNAMAPYERLGHGFVMAARHADDGVLGPHTRARLGVPLTPPFNLVNPASVWTVGQLYQRKNGRAARGAVVGYGPYFYYIDTIPGLKRLYGPRGFVQFQAVVPTAVAAEVLRSMLVRCRMAGQVSFLNALKVMGDKPGAGMLGFCRPGVTLAMDLPFKGADTLRLMAYLEHMVAAAGGALYPAKDATMSAASFKQWYPRWADFARYRDPRIVSDLWQRVTS